MNYKYCYFNLLRQVYKPEFFIVSHRTSLQITLQRHINITQLLIHITNGYYHATVKRSKQLCLLEKIKTVLEHTNDFVCLTQSVPCSVLVFVYFYIKELYHISFSFIIYHFKLAKYPMLYCNSVWHH